MIWTKSPPTEPGFYWFRHYGCEPMIDIIVVAGDGRIYSPGIGGVFNCAACSAHLYGPKILPPGHKLGPFPGIRKIIAKILP